MALYIPAGARRRRTAVIAVIAAIVGVVVGVAVTKATTPSTAERIGSIQSAARQTAAGLRVISLHDESGAVSASGSGDDGTQLVLDRTKSELTAELGRAKWIDATERDRLLTQLADLSARKDKTDKSFGKAADAMAKAIEQAFGTA
jgi:hypothetical protein